MHVNAGELHFVDRFDKPGREPCRSVVSDAFALMVTRPRRVRAGDDAATVERTDIDQARRGLWAFDHAEIFATAYIKLTARQLN